MKDYQQNDLITFTVDDAKDSLKHLNNEKACGTDRIQAEHLQHVEDRILILLLLLFTMYISHGYNPGGIIIYTVIVPFIKDRQGHQFSKDNYHPIANCSLHKRQEV